jgi:hypothetical protein
LEARGWAIAAEKVLGEGLPPARYLAGIYDHAVHLRQVTRRRTNKKRKRKRMKSSDADGAVLGAKLVPPPAWTTCGQRCGSCGRCLRAGGGALAVVQSDPASGQKRRSD